MLIECETLTANATVLPTFAKLVPVGDDVADQLRAIHALGQLSLVVIAGLDANAFEIGSGWRIAARVNEELLLDERRHLRSFDDHVEDPAESTAVAAAGRRGGAEDDRVRIGLAMIW